MEPTKRGRVRLEPTAKRVRAYFGGRPVADTTRALLVWEKPYYPTYYFPLEDVEPGLLKPTGEIEHSPSRGDGQVYALGDRQDAALVYPDSPIEELRGRVRFTWDALEAWFEEDEEVFVHARDPYTRVDILASSRRIRVEVGGVTVADSRGARILFETGLPTRYYLPKTDVRLDLLEHTGTVTHCPYKGTAEYWSVNGQADLAWSYPTPLDESRKVAGLISFYNEKVDVYVDEVLQERPKSLFS
ncbi:hypothetical protein Misp01_32800 [Microtetraspora sp. NBRC 13810]|uniref:DUF427 domain-containing protein n=1 Tax=Microtetraspora sp. NBRC 13810 TaxID=3030990 RepID=UPI0024A13117|nr:DUF427 domain-containing protein [Microtetraspora sp. NBRC 13810]GLW08150.1 hypothetical protein Misp01_32800 [Microtetraspora sp. NBRC 13810]